VCTVHGVHTQSLFTLPFFHTPFHSSLSSSPSLSPYLFLLLALSPLLLLLFLTLSLTLLSIPHPTSPPFLSRFLFSLTPLFLSLSHSPLLILLFLTLSSYSPYPLYFPFLFLLSVARSLASCQGALLLVDSTQSVQAQTLANHAKAKTLGKWPTIWPTMWPTMWPTG
jgi:hypothetical protein